MRVAPYALGNLKEAFDRASELIGAPITVSESLREPNCFLAKARGIEILLDRALLDRLGTNAAAHEIAHSIEAFSKA